MQNKREFSITEVYKLEILISNWIIFGGIKYLPLEFLANKLICDCPRGLIIPRFQLKGFTLFHSIAFSLHKTIHGPAINRLSQSSWLFRLAVGIRAEPGGTIQYENIIIIHYHYRFLSLWPGLVKQSPHNSCTTKHWTGRIRWAPPRKRITAAGAEIEGEKVLNSH